MSQIVRTATIPAHTVPHVHNVAFAQWYPLAPPLAEKCTNWRELLRAETKSLAQHNNYAGLSPRSICAEVVCVYQLFSRPQTAI